MLDNATRHGKLLGIISQVEDLIAAGNFVHEDTDDLQQALKHLCWAYRNLA